VEVGFYDFPGMQLVANQSGTPTEGTVATVLVVDQLTRELAARTASKASLGGVIELVDYEIGTPFEREDSQTLSVVIYWRAVSRVAQSYTVFVHMLDEEGRLVAQHDGPPGYGAFPVADWPAGEIVRDEHFLPLPSALRAGTFKLMAGMYDPKSIERLPAGGPGAVVADKAVFLGTVELP
jgi:hypothetical protein